MYRRGPVVIHNLACICEARNQACGPVHGRTLAASALFECALGLQPQPWDPAGDPAGTPALLPLLEVGLFAMGPS